MPEDTFRELYTALPEEFVAARAAAAAAAKAAGHAAQATAIGRLRRPTVAAWMVNLLAHHEPARIAELVELAGSLRAAQRELRGGDLRELTVRRRELLSALAAEAAQLAVRAQPASTPAKLPLAEVEDTLAAALADEDVAAQVRAGTVVKAVSYTGFGAALLPDAEPEPPEPLEPASRQAVPEAPRRESRQAMPGVPGPDSRHAVAEQQDAEPEPAGTGQRWAGKRREPREPAPAAGPESRQAGPDSSIAESRAARSSVAMPPAKRGTRSSAATTSAEPGAPARAARPAVPVGLRRELTAARTAEEQAREVVDSARGAEAAAAAELSAVRDALAALEERRSRAQQEANRRRAERTAAERALAAAVRRATKAQAAIDARAGPG